MGDKTRILILGGGFGGLYTALELERRIAGDPNVEVTLVNRENFFSFTPMLHEVAASDLDLTHIVNPVRKMLRHVNFVLADVDRIELGAREQREDHPSPHGSSPQPARSSSAGGFFLGCLFGRIF